MFGEDLFYLEEESKTKGLGLKLLPRILPYFRKYRAKIITATLLLLFSTVLSLFGPLLLKQAIDVDIAKGSIPGLIRTSIIYLALQAVIFLIGYFQRIELSKVGENAAADLKEKLFQHILNLPMSFFDRNPVGRLITRVESDTEALKLLFTSTAVVLVQDFALLIGMSVVMILVNWKLYLLIFALLPPFVYFFYWFQKRIRPIYVEIRRKVADINNFINETIWGLPVIQAFNQEKNFSDKMNIHNQEKYQKEFLGMKLWYRVWFMVDFGEVLGFVLVLGIGGIWALKGLITIGTLILFISYIMRLFMPLRGLSDQLNVIQRALASGERMFGILDTRLEEPGEIKPIFKTFQKEIVFSSVNFAYEPRQETLVKEDLAKCPEPKEWVLKDINLTIRKGEKVALVGETGAGKTSIINLLLRFYEPQFGKILLDDYELHKLDKHFLRRCIGFVPQDIILFPGSILDNLRLFDETISEDTVYNAAKRARIHNRILNLPEGYKTNLIQRGINLSQGERQLLSFARALVANPKILILDEATSSVDPQTEHLLQEGLTELLAGRTAIIIAHRLATVQMVDRIVVLHKGKIVEEGTHSELLSREGYYYRLYKLQYLTPVSSEVT
ncbi:MAG: ABC transporter ATP-binding protein [candidate division WOR-3 bacterium]